MEKKDLADPSIIAGELEQTCMQRGSRTRLQGLGLRSVLEGVHCVHRACLCGTYSRSEQVSVVVVTFIVLRTKYINTHHVDTLIVTSKVSLT